MAGNSQKIIICPFDNRYQIELDRDDVFTDDPGSGTPAMVYGPNGSFGTFWAACDTGELACGDFHELPQRISDWLESQSEAVDKFLF